MTKFIWTVQDAIRSRLTLVVECAACDRDAYLAADVARSWKLIQSDPWDLKFRCKGCRQLGKLVVMLQQGDVRTYKDQRAEHREKRRQRTGEERR